MSVLLWIICRWLCNILYMCNKHCYSCTGICLPLLLLPFINCQWRVIFWTDEQSLYENRERSRQRERRGEFYTHMFEHVRSCLCKYMCENNKSYQFLVVSLSPSVTTIVQLYFSRTPELIHNRCLSQVGQELRLSRVVKITWDDNFLPMCLDVTSLRPYRPGTINDIINCKLPWVKHALKVGSVWYFWKQPSFPVGRPHGLGVAQVSRVYQWGLSGVWVYQLSLWITNNIVCCSIIMRY